MPTVTLTLITAPGGATPEEIQAIWWRPVADAWPLDGPFVTLQVLTFAEAVESPESVRGGVAAAFIGADLHAAARLADALYARGIAAVFLAPATESAARAARLNSDSVIVLDESAPAAIVAATLRALAQRQPAMDAALTEITTARKQQIGMKQEMDRVAEELQLASLVQRDFLPRTLPIVPGAEFGVLFRPCGYVSGDIYDVLRLDEHHAGFFLADAIGHGVPAALMTMALCQTLPTKDITGSTYRVVPPAEALTRLNIELVRRQGESPRFASAVYGIIDVRDGTVTLAGAGHPPPLIVRGESMRRIDTPGGLLGVFADEVYEQTTFTLDPRETLLLYSDGFETAFPDGRADSYGRRLPTTHYIEHLAATAREVANGAPMASASMALSRRLDQQPGSLHQADDMTLLMLSTRPRTHLERPPDARTSEPVGATAVRVA